jgi:hypothetical protein
MVGSDPVSGYTVSIVTRLNRISELMASVTAFGPVAAGAAADTIIGLIQKHAPEDTGDLKASVTKTELGMNTWAVGPTVAYAPYVNYGTGPHVPNATRITDWAQRHGWDASELIGHIAKYGTAATLYMEAAQAEAQGMGMDLFMDKVTLTLVT